MCSPMLVVTAASGLFSAYSQYSQAKAQAKAVKVEAQSNKNIAEYNAQISEQNAELQRRAAADAVERGSQSAATIRDNVRKANARGRAMMGSSGLLVDTGTNLDLLTQNAGVGEQEALTVSNNAEREAYGYKVNETDALNQAKNLRYQGDLGVRNASAQASVYKQAGLLNATGSLIDGAGNFGKMGGFDSGNYGYEKIKWNNGTTGTYRRTNTRM